MPRDRKCILCETVHVSKQEMDEHMRSMLHHRELEKLKGRDCGHECRVCKVKVASLTDYAGHISSPTHKQKVEAAEQKHGGNDHDEDYFDQALVELIEKRKDQIRKEKDAAAAKLAKEEEDRRRKEEFQQRLQEAKQRYRLDGAWQQPPQGFRGSGQQRYNARAGGEARPWQHSKQGKSATWHAQDPPNLQRWASGEFSGSWGTQEGRTNKTWGPRNQQNRLPWLSNGGSSHGLYGQNNICQYSQRSRPPSLFERPAMCPPPPSFFAQALNQFQTTGSERGGPQGAGPQDREGPSAESDHNGTKSSKAFGSNPKLDKACRWSPYPVSKGFESVPHNDTNPNPSEKYPKAPRPQNQDRAPEPSGFTRQSRPEQKPGLLTSSRQNVEEKQKHKTKPRDGSSGSSRSSSSQRGGLQDSSASGSSSHKAEKPHKDRKVSSLLGLSRGAPSRKASSQVPAQPKPTAKQSGLKAWTPPAGPLQSRQEQQLPESCNKARQDQQVPESCNKARQDQQLPESCNKARQEQQIPESFNKARQEQQIPESFNKARQDQQLPESCNKARQVVSEVSGSADSSSHSRMELEEQQTDQSQVGVNKENSCLQDAAALPDEKPAPPSSDSSQFLQSLQVSTSTAESPEPAAPARDDEENRKKEPSCSVVPDEAMQAADAGQSSESDTSRGGEAPTVSGSNTSGLSRLDLPPVLKRDLTKHISSKSKPGGHEPNLNIARRVRNLSESRRSDPEKDSGLKPTVRQLISSSGSRRNVNWEQVYQEVKKKQDQGKGMPRFGIEMVPCEQEYQSQEEDDVPLLEGFQWESLMEVSSQGASRKRSLSESSLAPASALFTPLMSVQTSFSSEQQGPAASPSHVSAQCQLDVGLSEVKAQKQPDKLTSATVKALQRSDSLLGDSSSGAEQYDGQGTGKRRRAARDVNSTESSCLEHDSKRRKVKSKRERLQIDQLLTVSLREEELSRSLQTVDSSLIQARAALEAAYMEVQRLMVVKQQMATEMSTLRNKRIELLKGMQGTVENVPQVQLKEEQMDSGEPELHTPSSVLSPHQAAECASPPSSSLPFTPAAIKQEPQSPVHVSSELDPVDGLNHCAHSTTPELPAAAAAASPPDPALDLQPPPDRGDPAGCREKLPVLTTEAAVQAAWNQLSPLPDSKTSIKLVSPSRRGSEGGGVADGADAQAFQPPAVPSVLNMPASPSELRSGKRVRKLKKRKALKKAPGAEQPESTDTEMDEEASRPRFLRPRRRPSGGSQVSTSSLPTEDVNVEDSRKALKLLFPTIRLQKVDLKCFKQMVELKVNLDSEESMEVTAAGQQPHMEAPVPAAPPAPVPDSSSRPDPPSLACNEVSSTSDMDLCKSSESDMPFTVTCPKNSSDASSDHGEDELPTDGAFEGHQEAVNAMQIHNGVLYTCSGDRTVKAFDLVTHRCVGVFEGHSSKVSCLLVSAAPSLHHRLYSGSSDQTIRCYSLKTRELEQQFSLSDRVLCLHSRWRTLYAGLANGTVVTFNLKTNKQMDVFECHGPRAVSCLASSQEGARRILLVGSYDSTITVRDAKNGLMLRTLEGHTKTVLCMKVVNDLVFSGSSDQCVYTHNIHTGDLVRVYKGHSHAVTVVAVLGKVMVTACLDKLVRVYDLQSHEQLQVYGGHKDMVMCMAVHNNMIYTGCYDGSVQAVKLNLMQSCCCRWHGCSLVFGVTEHLQQHLINDHASAKLQTLKCRWKNCEEFLCGRSSSKQGMLRHMKKHAEEEEEETEVEP